jgi:hypothetical protein
MDDTTQAATPAVLGRDAILAADDRVFEIIDVPEWKGAVRVRSLSAKERDDFEESTWVEEKDRSGKVLSRRQSFKNARAKLIAQAVVDANGNPIFGADDIRKLGDKNTVALQRVFDRVLALSSMTEAASEKLGEDSGVDPDADSLSD